MTSTETFVVWLEASTTSRTLTVVWVILAIAALVLAISIAWAIQSAAKQGRIDVKISVNLGRTRHSPP